MTAVIRSMCYSILAAGALATGAEPKLTAPLPLRPEPDPLDVTSPLRVAWEGGGEMVVEIRHGDRIIFPAAGRHAGLASGCEFHLDPGVYGVTVREPGRAPYGTVSHPVSTWIRVRPQPTTFDLRSEAPGTRAQFETLRLSQKELRSQTDAIKEEVAKSAERQETIEDGLLLLLKQFTLVDHSGEKPVRVERPFQWLADRLKEIEDGRARTGDRK